MGSVGLEAGVPGQQALVHLPAPRRYRSAVPQHLGTVSLGRRHFNSSQRYK